MPFHIEIDGRREKRGIEQNLHPQLADALGGKVGKAESMPGL